MRASFLLSFLSFGFLATASWSSSGCGKRLPAFQEPGGYYNATIDDRRYVVYVPPEYSRFVPTSVVLSYHGGSESPEDQIPLDQFTNSTFNTRRMIVYPAGTPKSNCKTTCDELYWNVDPDITADDQGFTEDIIDALESTYCVDRHRIFASGKSQGGGFANEAACDPSLSVRIAAFAPVSGSFYAQNTTACDPATVPIQCSPGRRKIPMLEFHGGNDTTIAYGGGPRKSECLPTIPHWIQQWAVRDGLGERNRSSQLFSYTPNTTKFEWGQGLERGLVTHIFDAVIAHDWPYRYANEDSIGNGDQPATFDATPIIFDFFDRHPLPLLWF